uniref:Transport protein n=1 Tax=bacterium enrichment culture TaxID=207831 RepID=A0A0E3MTY3_9BACT|nr:transport protein [bacterium enrichment culture]
MERLTRSNNLQLQSIAAFLFKLSAIFRAVFSGNREETVRLFSGVACLGISKSVVIGLVISSRVSDSVVEDPGRKVARLTGRHHALYLLVVGTQSPVHDQNYGSR